MNTLPLAARRPTQDALQPGEDPLTNCLSNQVQAASTAELPQPLGMFEDEEHHPRFYAALYLLALAASVLLPHGCAHL